MGNDFVGVLVSPRAEKKRPASGAAKPSARRLIGIRDACALSVVLLAAASSVVVAGDAPIQIEGPEQGQVDVSKPNGGLNPLPGVQSYEVFHADREHPEEADGKGYTYHHHPDLGCWKGRLYLGWNSCEKDEDTWPSRELYSTSADGKKWDAPRELFPMGLSTPIRMFFFHAPNGRMLAIAGLRMSRDPLVERNKGPVIVREIREDHSLGEVHLLVAPKRSATTSAHSASAGEVPTATPPPYRASSDEVFVQACEQLLANRPFLEQQDYGTALGDRRMKWHDIANWTHADAQLKQEGQYFGKGMSLFHRKDGALVAIGKRRFVTVSTDEGGTWSPPVRPPTLVSGGAKVWGKRTSDGRYALVYNPHASARFPLVVVHGDDGITFSGMRVVFGEKPPSRYPGLYKEPGPQYVRGISEWAGDGSWKDAAMWVCYSVNKEDIWVSRIPVPIGSDAGSSADIAPSTAAAGDTFRELVPANAKAEKLAGGMKFTEGAVWLADAAAPGGGSVVLSDQPNDALMRWNEKTHLSVLRKPADHPNGHTLDLDGSVIGCQQRPRRVARFDAKLEQFATLVDRCDGKRFNSPNDVVVKSDGTVWFTDPTYGLPEGERKEMDGNYVYRFEPNTGACRAVAKGFDQPNGLAFSPDEKTLYVADSGKPHNIRAFLVAADGALTGGNVLCTIDKGVPDGIRCDEHGNVWSSAGDGIQIFAKDGKLVGRIPVPESSANLCFGGPDGKSLYITARTSLYRVQVNVRDAQRP